MPTGLLSLAVVIETKVHFQSEVFILQDTNFMNNSMQNLYKNVQQAPSANRIGECFCIFLIRVKYLVSIGPTYPAQLHYI